MVITCAFVMNYLHTFIHSFRRVRWLSHRYYLLKQKEWIVHLLTECQEEHLVRTQGLGNRAAAFGHRGNSASLFSISSPFFIGDCH
jgi:hypothetical protein